MSNFMIHLLSVIVAAAASAAVFMWIGYWVAQGIRLAGGLVI
jgi:hypothetical protein